MTVKPERSVPKPIRDYLTVPDRATLDRLIIKDRSGPSEFACIYASLRGATEKLDRLLTAIGLLVGQRRDCQSLGRWGLSCGSGNSRFFRIGEMLLSRDRPAAPARRDRLQPTSPP
jgi:hypothetical protein